MLTPLRAALITPALFCLALLTLLPAHGQAAPLKGSGKSATETRNLPEFQAITMTGSMDLVMRQGAQSVQVMADDNLLPMLETLVENTSQGATLVVRWKKGKGFTGYSTQNRVLITVVVPKLSALVTSGSGDMSVESFNTPALKLSISGSGDAKLAGLTAGELSIAISGSGDVGGSGTAGKLKIGIAGSGDVKLTDMKAEDVTVSIAGSGDAAVNASKTLNVSIAGSGDVTYTGNAQVKSSVAGSGKVKRK